MVLISLVVIVLEQVRAVGGEQLQEVVDGRERRVVRRDVVAVKEVQQNPESLVEVHEVGDRLFGIWKFRNDIATARLSKTKHN